MTPAYRPYRSEWIAGAVALAALLASIYGSYAVNDKANSVATATVEAHEQDMSQRMDRLENKLDTLIYYITGVKADGR